MRAIQPNAWRAKRWGGDFPAGWKLGFFTGSRKLQSKNYYPGPRQRAGVGHLCEPFFFTVNLTPTSRDSADGMSLPVGDVAIIAMMATTDQAGQSFQSQLYQVLSTNPPDGHRFNRSGVDFANMFGTAQRPFIFRQPYRPPELKALLSRVANVTTNTNTIQLVFFGMRRIPIGGQIQ